MKGLGQIIADNARTEGKIALAFTVYVVVDPTTISEMISRMDEGQAEVVVRDEITSNLESVTYVESVTVKRENDMNATQSMIVWFSMNDRGSPAGKLADAELHFADGILQGLKLIGFGVWEGKRGGRNVTFPARTYSVNGERRSFSLLRSIAESNAQEILRDVILEAYSREEQASNNAE